MRYVVVRQIAPPTEYHLDEIYRLVDTGYGLNELLEYCDRQPDNKRAALVGAVMTWAMTLQELDNDGPTTTYELSDTDKEAWPPD